MRSGRSHQLPVLLAGFVLSLVLLGASAGAAVAATQALPVAVTGSTNWSVATSLPPAGPSTVFTYGLKPLVPVMGDWDGDGDRTPGTFEGGRFKLSNTLPPGSPTIDVAFGDPRGFPVVGDFNGDGFDDVAVFRGGAWTFRVETGGIGSGGAVTNPAGFTFGTGSWPSTIPVAGDWDGDDIDGIGVYTYASGLWQLRQTPAPFGSDLAPFTYWVGSGSYPVVGDWTGDGTDGVGVKSGSLWHLNNESDAGPPDITPFAFGLANDLPLVGGAAVDVPPAAVDDAATVVEDAAATAVGVLANDTDPDGGPKSVTSVTQPANGTVAITGGGTGVSYTPNANYCNSPPGTSPDTFSYTLAPGGSSATVSMTVTCVDDPPVAVNDSATVAANSGANAVDVLANDTDVDGGAKSVASVTQPANGSVVITGGGTGVSYTPNANYCNSPPGTSPDTFSYTLTPGGSTATVSVTVTCAADTPPTAVDDAATVLEDAAATAVGVLANDTDPDGGPKSVTSVTQPANGTVAITGGGTGVSYTPNANYCNSPPGTSPDTFSYTLAPGGSSATVSMTVTCVDDPPVAVDNSATVNEDDPAAAVLVLGNDTDIDGGSKSIESVTQPANGTVAITGGGTGLTYQPDPNYCNNPPGTSPDTFTYTLTPGGSTATVSMTVTCVADNPVVDTSAGSLAYTENDPPTPIDPNVTVTDADAGAMITGATVAVTTNFAAGQDVLALSGIHPGISAMLIGNTLSLTGTATPAAYQAALRAVTYANTSEGPSTPARTVTFTVTDDTALSGSDTRGITVAGVNDPPTAVDDVGTTDEDTPLNVAAPGVLANDTDVDPGDTKTVVALNGSATLTGSTAQAGSVTINANGSYTYTPPATFQALSTGQSDTDSFQYTMRDAANAQSTATVNLTVEGVSDAPTAVADTFDAVGNTGLFVGTTRPAADAGKEITGSVLTNDTDPDSPHASLVVEPVTNAPTTLGGTITIEADGNFTYHPDDGDVGATDAFTYRVCDNSPCNSGTVANATGTINLVLSGQVWYVRNNEPAGGDGTSDAPFDTLLEAEAASGTADTVFVFDGDNTSTNLDTGYVMQSAERLIGESRPLSLDPDGGGPLPTVNLHPGASGAQPMLTASNEDVIVLASNTLVDGVDVNPSGTGGGISGVVGAGDVTVQNVNVSDTGTAGTQPGIELDGTSGVNRFTGVTVTNGGSATAIGVRLNNAASVLFADTATNTIATAGAKALDAASTNLLNSRWNDITVTGSGSGAIRLSSITGSPDLGDGAGTDLSLQTTSGATAALDIASSNSVSVDAGGTDAISATGGPAADIRNSNGSTFDFESVSSTNSAGDGINLDTNLTTPFTAAAGAISGAAGIAVDVNAGGVGGTVSYGGAINDGSGQSVEVTNRTGGGVTLSGNIGDGSDTGGGIVLSGNTGGTTTFSGSAKVLNTGSAAAVSSTTSSSSSVLSFTNGGLDIDTTGGAGFSAQTGGTVNVTGAGNSITTGTGQALNLTSTSIGASDATFQTITQTGGTTAIFLQSTGSAGGLKVTGTGSAGSGGTIQNTTSDSVVLTTTNEVDLRHMNITNSAENGINGNTVTGFDMTGMNITGSGDDSNDVGVRLAELRGSATWNNLTANASELANVRVENTGGTLDALDITGASHFDNLGTAFGGNAVLIEMRGTAVMTRGSVDGATFVNNRPARGITVQAQEGGRIGDASTNAFVVQNSTFTSNGLHASFEQSGTANLTFRLLNNGTPATPMTMPNIASGSASAVNVFSSSTSTGGTIRGRISGNRIGNAAVAGSGSPVGNGIRTVIQGATVGTLLYDSNTIRQTHQARGIDIQVLGPLNAAGSGPHDITVTNNDVSPSDITGFPASAIYVAADSQGGGTVTVRTDIRGNTVPAGAAVDSLPAFLALDEVAAGAVCQLVDTAPASANATAQLASTNTGSAQAAAGCALIAGPIGTPP